MIARAGPDAGVCRRPRQGQLVQSIRGNAGLEDCMDALAEQDRVSEIERERLLDEAHDDRGKPPLAPEVRWEGTEGRGEG